MIKHVEALAHELPQRRYFDLSTAHITIDDDRLLRRITDGGGSDGEANRIAALNLYVDTMECGWLVSVCGEFDDIVDSGLLLNFGFSLAFVDLVRCAARHAMRGIWLDADAPIVDELAQFTW